jgi:polyphosphate kinase
MDCLYQAASKHVKIHMIVRGICGINPFYNRNTEKNIRIVSIIDRFLEHPRIYYFRNNDSHEYYLGSADLMQRNLSRRIELLFPVEKEDLKHELGSILRCGFADNRKGRTPIGPNRYSRTVKSLKNEKNRSQIKLYNYYSKRLQMHREEQSRNQALKIFKTPGGEV